MAISDDDLTKIATAVKQAIIDKDGGTVAQYLRQIRAAGDVDKIAAAVVAKLPSTAGGGLTKADVTSAVRAVFADAGQP